MRRNRIFVLILQNPVMAFLSLSAPYRIAYGFPHQRYGYGPSLARERLMKELVQILKNTPVST